eukprot:scaffold418933_cov40-Prasinocladus_malaysianus.AAC.2
MAECAVASFPLVLSSKNETAKSMPSTNSTASPLDAARCTTQTSVRGAHQAKWNCPSLTHGSNPLPAMSLFGMGRAWIGD